MHLTRLLVGLGNPGSKYAGNRHNVGFMVVAQLAERLGAAMAVDEAEGRRKATGAGLTTFRDGFDGRVIKTEHRGHPVVLLQPMTFMNRSGESVQAAMAFYKIALGDVVIVHDELDLPFGEVRLKLGGGAAGHNGLKSVAERCGGLAFARVRVGIGRPPVGKPVGWVLGDFSAEERVALDAIVATAVDAVLGLVADGAEATMLRLHTKPNP